MAKGKWYDITFIVDGYIVLRVQAENEDDAEEMASLELNKALEASKGFWKYELDYPDGPFIEEVMDVDWQGFQVKPLPEPQPGQPLRGGDRPRPLPEARPPQEITKADEGEAVKLHVLVAFEKGVPANDPIVTSSYEEAQERFKGLCEHYSLPLDDPHSDEDDIWWWELECAIRVVRTGSGIIQIMGIRSEA